jgi:hypothetical protein
VKMGLIGDFRWNIIAWVILKSSSSDLRPIYETKRQSNAPVLYQFYSNFCTVHLHKRVTRSLFPQAANHILSLHSPLPKNARLP